MSRETNEGMRIRGAVAGLGRRRRTERIPMPIRQRVVAYAERGRREGRSWREIGQTVGLASYTVQRWVAIAAEREKRPSLVPVQVELTDVGGDRGLVVVTPSGHRLEGLACEEAVAVLRALG